VGRHTHLRMTGNAPPNHHARRKRRKARERRPRCECGKAIFGSKAEAQVNADRWGLARVYVCEFNFVHTTRLPRWDPMWGRPIDGGSPA